MNTIKYTMYMKYQLILSDYEIYIQDFQKWIYLWISNKNLDFESSFDWIFLLEIQLPYRLGL